MMLVIKGLAAIGTAAGLYKLVGLVHEKYGAYKAAKTGKLHKVRSLRNQSPDQEA